MFLVEGTQMTLWGADTPCMAVDALMAHEWADSMALVVDVPMAPAGADSMAALADAPTLTEAISTGFRLAVDAQNHASIAVGRID